MQIACPKCSSQLTVPAGAGAPKPGASVQCKHCGSTFDFPVFTADSPKSPAIPDAPKPSTPSDPPKPPAELPAKSNETVRKDKPALEALSPEEAAEVFKKHKLPPAPPQEKSSRHLPKSIGGYEVHSELNRGGMGIVYKALDTQLRRQVAIKVLLAGEGAKDEDIKRFQREAQATARLMHPNIVPIYAVGTHDDKPYLVMDFVEGKTAKQLKEEGKMTPRLALSIIEGCAEGLHHAHLHGVIHRDVKPANIMVDRNEHAQLMDFGLARRVDEDLEVTQSGTTMGTPSYMAPEQAEGHLDQVDARSDVYSVGACLYELLTGRPPFEANTVMGTLKLVLEEPPVPPRRLNTRIHRDVETICLKCLEKDKRNRYESAKQLADDIRRFNAGEAIMAKPLGFFAAKVRWARHHWEVSLAVLVMLLSGIAALGYAINKSREVMRRQIVERENSLRRILDGGKTQLNAARSAVFVLSDNTRPNYLQDALRARSLVADATTTFRQAQAVAMDNPEAKEALAELHKLDVEAEVRRFVHKARTFLYPPASEPGQPQTDPNFAGAEFAAQEAVDRDPENAEARQLLHSAMGIRQVEITCGGVAAEVFARRILDPFGRPVSNDPPGLGKSLGPAPVREKELEPGLYVISFQRPNSAVQQATLQVGRDAKDNELTLNVKLDAADENMVRIAAGSVSLPQQGVVKIPAYSIDRFEFPNKAGQMPRSNVTLAEAPGLCKKQGKELCTAAQWLRACMGDSERRYPYGETYVSRVCAVGLDADAQKIPVLSGQYSRCRTAEGIYDMSGNVAEWTETDQDEKVFGGDWTSSTRYPELTVSCRARSLPEEVVKERRGFRCCKK
ncbi:MAG TPA: protein kinase [Planctomycetota bacterium]|jgi:hypothetical protein